METRRMHLHLGKCIEDLDKMHTVPDLKSKRTTVLCKSALKLFEKAEEFREKGDEEYAYVYYMKYLRVVAFLSKEKDYLKDKPYYNSMLGAKNPKKAIDVAEKLKKSLIDRYKISQSMRMDTPSEPESIDAISFNEPAPIPGLPGLDEVTINCDELYPILKAGKLKVMILDCRPGKDYINSHINYPTCISVPEEVITPGQSANILEVNLPLTSRAVWTDRASMDIIVMLDWRSTTVIPGKPLFLLKTILLKWDVKVQYARPPLTLWGGYEDWMLKYPAFTTNPQPIPPIHTDDIEVMLGDIEYPSWAELSSPVQAPVAPPLRIPRSNEPVVDRSSKAAAVQIYEERARHMQSILEQQERIADTSLTLEMQRIEAEQDWQYVRGQRESEVHEELRAKFKLREQEILSKLMQLENRQYDMKQENQSLREQLEEYQRREREEAARLAGTIAIEKQADEERKLAMEQAAAAREVALKRARIAAVTEQRDELDRRREAMEAERKRKLAEAREKKKPDNKKKPDHIDKDEDGDTYMSSPRASPPASALTRSLSSPNLANGTPCTDEEEPVIPTFDRSTKPTKMAPSSDLRQRDFKPVWRKVERGHTGLKNLGNTCYMNSILQCLNNTTILMNYFCNDKYLAHINRSSSTRGAVAEEFAAVVRALWSGQYNDISAVDLRNELGKHQRAFRGYDQQDSHEFLTILIDWLHLDLQVNIRQPNRHIQESWSASDKAWFEFTKGKESVISRLFFGQIKSTVQCSVCSKTSVTYDVFSSISLELPPNVSRCSLTDCLELYLSGEAIYGWKCPTCRQKRAAVKKLDISRLPPVLVIHFKRFYMEEDKFVKRMTYIDFPITDLDMRPYSLISPPPPTYDLFAVSNHYGKMQFGHYTAICKGKSIGKWLHFDDHIVTVKPESEVKSSAAYILFYTNNRNV